MRTIASGWVVKWHRAFLHMALVLGVSAVGCAGSADIKTLSPDEAALKWFECGGGGVWPKGCDAYLVWGDFEKGASGWYIRAPAGYTFPKHFHTPAERILLVRGKMTSAVEGTAEATVKAGGYTEYGGKAVHWARCDEACLMYITYDHPFDLTFK